MVKPKKSSPKKATKTTSPKPPAPTPYEYVATVSRVVDGDTVHLTLEKEFALPVDFGFNIKDTVVLKKTAEIDFRLYGINTPETHGKEATTGGQMAAGLKSKVELERLLKLGTLRVVSTKPDKYGRYLATIFVKPSKGPEINVNEAMVKGGFAKAYFGTGVKPV
jgi:endonuclease YncB( thermonuclease family)